MIWKKIEGFKGRYLISDMGEVKSLITGRILRPAIDTWGYKRGFEFWGYELDPEYFQASEKRFQQHKSQLKLF